MNIGKMIVDAQQKQIMDYAKEYMNTKDFQRVLKKSVVDSIRDEVREYSVEDLMKADRKRKFRAKIESAICKALGL